MKKRIAIAALVAGLGLTAAGASAIASPDAKPAGRSCFFASQVNGWRSERSEETVYLDVGVRDVYRAEIFGNCLGIDNAVQIGVRTRGGSTRVCDGLDVELLVSSPIGPQTCHVSKLTKLTPDEVQALKTKKR